MPSYPPEHRARPLSPPFVLDESKLDEPAQRHGIVDRTALIDRLLAVPNTPVLAVTAPPGYGKTSFLAQWVRRTQRRSAWISLDARDNDPAVLLTYLATVLDRIEPADPRGPRSVPTPGSAIVDLVGLTSSMRTWSQPFVIVLDDADVLTNSECRDMVRELAFRIPRGSQLAIGSRHEVPLPVSQLRARGAILEVGADDLAMDANEARALLDAAGVEIADVEHRTLVERTEGWPAGLYLAALAINAGSRRATIHETFSGDDRYVGDYLRSEFLGRVSRAEASFLTRTSILERLTGPLCDAVVGGTGSGRILDRLERRNLLILPLDRRGEWYRYHHLFRELLLAELNRREPDTIETLHLRAATWFEANQMPEAAIEHAQRSGDAEFVARLVLREANPAWAEGRLETVLRWMEWFADHDLVTRHPDVAVHGALMYALIGKAAEAQHWAATAERAETAGTLSDGNTMASSVAYLRALVCREGIAQMRVDATTALSGLAPTSPYRPAMLHALGMAELLDGGDRAVADGMFARAFDEAAASGSVPTTALLLGERGLVALMGDDWSSAESFADRALQIIDDGELEGYWTSALVFAWAARVAVHRGDVERGRELTRRAARLRPLLTYGLPIVSVQALIQLAMAYIALADPSGAAAALRQIADIQQFRPSLGTMSADIHQLRTRVNVLKGELLGASSLTTAELRVLPLLATHLSLAEISERLFVSRNTIKSQTVSIYRKLGVSTRNETIKRMVEVGLVAQV